MVADVVLLLAVATAFGFAAAMRWIAYAEGWRAAMEAVADERAAWERDRQRFRLLCGLMGECGDLERELTAVAKPPASQAD